MSKIHLTITTIILVLTTIFICISSPKLHKKFVITDSNVKIVDAPLKSEETVPIQPAEVPIVREVSNKDLQALNVPEKTKKSNSQIVNTQNIKTTSQKVSVTPQTQQKVTTTKQKAVQTQTKPKTTQSKPSTQTKSITTTKKIQTKPQTTQSKSSTTQTAQKAKTTQQKIEIDWEKWRNNINAKIVANSTAQIKKSVPIGTKYEYSFNVDNKKKISDIRVAIISKNETKEVQNGVNIIILAIMNLENNSILTYPEGAEGITSRKVAAYITIKEQN